MRPSRWYRLRPDARPTRPASPTSSESLRPAAKSSVADGRRQPKPCGTQDGVVSILAHTGLRFGELTGLNAEDLELSARRIRVRRCVNFEPAFGLTTDPSHSAV
jgi:integrase